MWKKYAEVSMITLMCLIFSCNAFWWRSTTEATPIIKQIPIGYFRTYTYHQPLSYPGSYYPSPSSPFMYDRFSGWSQFPSSNSNPPILASKYDTPSSTTHPPAPPSTTTTTTTTTPAPPTQAPIQQHHYHYQSPPASASFISASSATASGHSYVASAQVPAPQPIASAPIRAHSYPSSNYPSYQYYNSPNSNFQQTYPQQYNSPLGQSIRFVPCMCPVTVTISSEYPEGRSASENDDDGIDLPENGDDSGNNINTSSENVLTSKEDLSSDNTSLGN